ncbi:IPT/TIG domain-containing protein [Flavobacterium sp. 103]|uniref:IPT/TIG domain-containing protein n=1 Tax=Flavobacterium sp. 103 TaxID=2135624 RepID=UPI000D5E19D0|nr:IPT/TIG domain-containing protein [Flavobacterium sp. 103]PVX44442.1 IPT/TIG domain-containing protein [Flavobacterium sp. 103]
MKKQIRLLMVLPFVLLFGNCSKDSEVEAVKVDTTVPEPKPTPVPLVEVKINSYSKNYGRKDDIITIYGENFTDKIEDISLVFDGIPAKIISATSTEIKFKIPDTMGTQIPILTIIITNSKVTNLVKNCYNGNIAILGNRSPSPWIVMNSPSINASVSNVQILDNRAIYYHTESKTTLSGGSSISYFYVYRSFDEGKTWGIWIDTQSDSRFPFSATTNDEGWSLYGSANLYKTLASSGTRGDLVFKGTSTIGVVTANENLTAGTIVTYNGTVYDTNDGINFSNVYTSNTDTYVGLGLASFALDNNHIWVTGYKGITVNSSYTLKPFMIYKNTSSAGWKEKFFTDEPNDTYIREIQFFDADSGLLLLVGPSSSKIYKSNNGGDNWISIYNGENFSNFVFKDATTGWATLKNVIYKTTDGGASWSIEYNHNEDILKIAYKDNVIWAFSKTKILKRNL